MIVREVLRKAENTLTSYSIDDAHLEAELLLMHAMGIDRVELYMSLEQLLSATHKERFWYLLQRRFRHQPTAYILGDCQFYGIDFYIDSGAFIPRPESELLVEITLEFARQRFLQGIPCLIADVGTGSGAIAIAIALNLPQAKVYAIDISTAALEVARINCQKHKVAHQVHLLHGDMLSPLPEPIDIIVANLPYVRDSELSQLSPEVRLFEPIIALAGGEDGLDKVRQLLPQARQKLLPKGLILVEIGQGQSKAARALAESYFPHASVELIPDLGGIERVIKIAT